jgi:signal transduction histidine kinase
LAIIKNYLGVLDEKATRQESLSGEISILNEEIDRVSNMLSEFAGGAPKVQAMVVDVNAVIRDLVRLFRESKFMPPTVQITSQIPEQAAAIEGSADLIKQILINLIKNSVEAMTTGGQIVVKNRGLVQREGRSFFELHVTDTGPGIPAEVLGQLFSPVVSTKAGKNRGVGLSIVHSLMKKLSGSITCHSTKEGTVFELLIPARKLVKNMAVSMLSRDIK